VCLRYECSECSHSFCGAHARDSWLSEEEEEEDSEEPEAPATRGRSSSLEKPPDLDPFFYDLACAKSAKELKERALQGALLLTQVLRKGIQI